MVAGSSNSDRVVLQMSVKRALVPLITHYVVFSSEIKARTDAVDGSIPVPQEIYIQSTSE